MALKFNPKPGMILLCDYSGFKVPEMVKRRPAVVILPRHRSSGLYPWPAYRASSHQRQPRAGWIGSYCRNDPAAI